MDRCSVKSRQSPSCIEPSTKHITPGEPVTNSPRHCNVNAVGVNAIEPLHSTIRPLFALLRSIHRLVPRLVEFAPLPDLSARIQLICSLSLRPLAVSSNRSCPSHHYSDSTSTKGSQAYFAIPHLIRSIILKKWRHSHRVSAPQSSPDDAESPSPSVRADSQPLHADRPIWCLHQECCSCRRRQQPTGLRYLKRRGCGRGRGSRVKLGKLHDGLAGWMNRSPEWC